VASKKENAVKSGSIYRANRMKAERTRYLDEFLDVFELLKLEVRLAAELKLLPHRKQANLDQLMEGIGRQITGWRKNSG